MEGFEESARLDSRQVIFFNAVVNALHRREPAMFFLEGPSGTGKTFLLNAIHQQAITDGKRVVAAAFSVVGSTLLSGGTTTHSLFVLPWSRPLDEEEYDDISGIEGGSPRRDWLSSVDIILWDEVQRSEKSHLERADEMIRKLSRVDSSSPFGGKVVVFSGDQRGLLPVNQPSAFSWEFWPHVKSFSLTINHMFSEEWFQKLMEIGSGGCQLGSLNPGTPKSYALFHRDMMVQSIQELIEQTFGECIDENNPQPTFGRAVLTLTNKNALTLGEDVLNYIHKGQEVHDIVGTDDRTGFEDSTPSEYPPRILTLAVGAEIILLQTVYTSRDTPPYVDLQRGTILSILKITDDYLMCKIRNGIHAGKEEKIIKEEFTTSGFKRTQFPVRLSYTMTVHKAQGRTLDRAGLFLNSHVFCHGQLYAALSRVKRQEDIKIYFGLQIPVDKLPEINSIYNEVDKTTFLMASKAERLE